MQNGSDVTEGLPWLWFLLVSLLQADSPVAASAGGTVHILPGPKPLIKGARQIESSSYHP
ncbi:hypothetical protein [Kitasatospora sp. NPDC004531]